MVFLASKMGLCLYMRESSSTLAADEGRDWELYGHFFFWLFDTHLLSGVSRSGRGRTRERGYKAVL